MMIDFITRRQAALKAKREQIAEWEAEDDYEKNVLGLYYEYEARLERERVERRKYEAAMTEKRALDIIAVQERER
jgi:hypothetical protein